LQNSQISPAGADYRNLLLSDEWPEGYEDSELVNVYENIIIELQEIRGVKFYENHIEKEKAKQYDLLRIRALEFACMAGYMGFYNQRDEILKAFKFKGIKTLQDIDSKKQQIIQKLEIEHSENQNKHYVKLNFEDILTDLKHSFPGVVFDYNITVAEYESWQKKIKNG
jgi:hypothetical protein